MRKEYAHTLRKAFEGGISSLNYGWAPRKLEEQGYPGERVFFVELPGKTTLLWCVLVPHARFDEFFIEIGWSRLGRFPELPTRVVTGSKVHDYSASECLIRMSSLLSSHTGTWIVEEFVFPSSGDAVQLLLQENTRVRGADECSRRVLPRVDEALAALVQYGHPYLAPIKNGRDA